MNSSVLNIELNITNKCNLRCEYCTEVNKRNSFTFHDIKNDFFVFFDNLLESSFFKNNYKSIIIYFWGGEPTTEEKLILEIIEKYENNQNVNFGLYTNGYMIGEKIKEKLLLLKETFENGKPKILTQISYDGQPIQDLKRKTCKGEGSANLVKSTIKWFSYNKIPFMIKSTITYDTLKYLYDVYIDLENLNTLYNIKDYSPTLDIYNYIDLTDAQEYIFDFQINMKKIIKHIITKVEKGEDYFNFSWLNFSNATCAWGTGIFSIDINGNIFPCHGCFGGTKDHILGNISEGICVLERSKDRYKKLREIKSPECKNCIATNCSRCNVVLYDNSTKPTYEERWCDYTNNITRCYIMKEIGKYYRAYNLILSK